MGKGDTRTRRGKVANGSYGKTRAHETPKPTGRERVYLEFIDEVPVKTAKKVGDEIEEVVVEGSENTAVESTEAPEKTEPQEQAS